MICSVCINHLKKMAGVETKSFVPYSRHGDRSQEEKVLQPFIYLYEKLPADEIISKLSLAFNYWLHIPQDRLQPIESLIQMIYKISLMYDSAKFACMAVPYSGFKRSNALSGDKLRDDDVQDGSEIRGGIPTAHSVFGTAATIKAATFAYVIALEKIVDLGHPDAVKIYTEQLHNLHRGEGMEIYHTDNFICPTEEEYKETIVKKTSYLFLLQLGLMQLFSEDKRNFKNMTELIGLLSQIRNDFVNLQSESYMERKGYCEDITEGKFSFPIIHAIQNEANSNMIKQILRLKTKNIQVKKYCISLMEKCGSFEYTKNALVKVMKEAKEAAMVFGENPYMDDLLTYIYNSE